MDTNGTSIRTKRNTAGIPGQVLCKKMGFARSRLSDIERGYFTPERDELARIDVALDELIRAKVTMQQTAVSLGWPATEAARAW